MYNRKKKLRLRAVLVELIALILLSSALAVPALAEEEYQVTATIKSPEQQSGTRLSSNVDVYEDIIVIGEPFASVEDLEKAGKAHIYDLDGNLKVTLQSPTPQVMGTFGFPVAIKQDLILVGAHTTDIGDKKKAGSAYLYNLDGSLQTTIQSPTPMTAEEFGWSLCFSGDTIVVSECYADVEDLYRAGEVHLYDSDGNFLKSLQSPEPSENTNFGWSIDGGEGIFVVSEHLAKVGDTVQAGKAHIYDSDGDLLATLQSPEPQNNAVFGLSLAASENLVVVSEFMAEVEGNSKAGRAHIFDTDGNLLASLQSPEPEAVAMFGWWVDTSGDLILVGEPGANGGSSDEGRAYLFDPEGNLLQTLSAPEPTVRAEFGNSVCVKGGIIVVRDYDASNVGRTYIFQPGAAAFISSSLTIDPSSVEAGGTVTISAEVTNTGSESGSHTVALKVDGEVVEEKTVTLNPDEAETVSFEVSTSQLGTFEVEVDGQTGSYTVTEKKEEPSRGIPGFPYEAIVLGVLAGVVILWMWQRRN